jgi:hypothetical protein
VTSEATLDAFRRTVIDTLARAERAAALPDFAGAAVGDMLEHNVRRVALDPFLHALGWSIQNRAEEARVVGETTLFIDYLGVDEHTRVAEMIFEAKALNASWVIGQGDYAGRPTAEVVAAAINHLNGGAPKDSPVTKEWLKRLKQVRDYVVGVEANGGAVVQRAAIGSARWIVIVKDPGKAFLKKMIEAEEVLALQADQMVERSDHIYQLLSAEALKAAPREPVHPDELVLHLPNGGDIRRLFRATHVTRDVSTDPYGPQPSIYVNAWLIAQRKDGALLTIRAREPALILPANPKFLEDHLRDLLERSDQMLAELRASYPVELPALSPIGAFPNFVSDTASSPVRRDRTGSNYLVATGLEAHYLRAGPVVDCVYHSHEVCRLANMADEPQPVTARSYERRSFFITNEAHHCAHRQIQNAKRGAPACPIDVFEAKLCCRACTLQDWCWSSEKLKAAPCGTGVAAA